MDVAASEKLNSALSLLPGLSNGPKPTDLSFQGSINFSYIYYTENSKENQILRFIFKQYSLLGFRFPSFIVVALPQL